MASRKRTRSAARNKSLDAFADVDDAAAQLDTAFDEGTVAYADRDEVAIDEQRAGRKRGARGQLRLAGGLDESLTKGIYKARPLSAAEALKRGWKHDDDEHMDGEDEEFSDGLDGAGSLDDDADDLDDGQDYEGKMDEIFGLLEEDDQEAEAAAGIKTEEEYAEWYEKRRKEKRAAGAPAKKVAPRDEDLVAQVAELRKKQEEMQLAGARTNLPSASKSKTATTNVHAAQALVQFRAKLQATLSDAVRLPQYYSLKAFVAGDKLCQKTLTESKQHILGILRELDDCTADSCGGVNSSDAAWEACARHYKQAIGLADTALDYWGQTAAARHAGRGEQALSAIGQPTLQQIKSIVSNKERLVDRCRRNRSHVKILGHPEHGGDLAATQRRAERIASGDMDAEIFNDADFARELIQSVAGSDIGADNVAAVNSAAKDDKGISKVGLHRKTKGRTLNYEPRPKLVGFMAPDPYCGRGTGVVPVDGESSTDDVSGWREALISSIFQC